MQDDTTLRPVCEVFQHFPTVILIATWNKMLHKPDGYAHVRIQFVSFLAYPAMIYMDLSFDEPLCLEPECRTVLTHPFPDERREVLAYSLEELLAEKIRSLAERGKSRDYYDVWRLLKEHCAQINLGLLGTVLEKKLKHKGLYLRTVGDFLPANPAGIRRYWEKDLGQQVTMLLPLEDVLDELKGMLDSSVAPYLPLQSG